MSSCVHCKKFTNTHHRCSLTCYDCGKPLRSKVVYIGITLDKANIGKTWEMRQSSDFGWQSMYHHDRAVYMNGHPLKHDGEQVYVDNEMKCYVIV